MTVFTQAQEESLVELEDFVITTGSRLLSRGVSPLQVERYLNGRILDTPGLGAARHECAGPRCTNTTDSPVRDEQAVFWIGDEAATYCSEDCIANAAEEWAERAIERAWSA